MHCIQSRLHSITSTEQAPPAEAMNSFERAERCQKFD